MNKKKGVNKEKLGWFILAETSLNKFWDNKEDDRIWNNYLENQ